MSGILVIEDESGLRGVLSRLIEAAGYPVTAVGTGHEGLRLALAHDFELLVLDLNLPDLAGGDLLRAARAAKPALRVLVLSSVTSVSTRVQVLEEGAADFVLKPFVAAELLARIRLRIKDDSVAKAADQTRLPVAADAYLDLQRQELTFGSHRIPLSQREFGLLTHLVHRRGKICTREELLADVWGIGRASCRERV